MTNLMLFATAAPDPVALDDGLTRLECYGVRARLACWCDPGPELHNLPLLVEARRVGELSWLTRRVTGARRKIARVDTATQRWQAARRDTWVRRAIRDADFAVALDLNAVYPVWELARRRPGIRATYGLYAVWADLEGKISLRDGR